MAKDQPEVVIDLSRATEELERMINGEIPFDTDYINELVESNVDDMLDISFGIVCADCNSLMVYKACPECEIVTIKNCSLCNGSGGWFECEECDGDLIDG